MKTPLIQTKALDISSGACLFAKNIMAREFSKPFYNSKEWQKVREFVILRDHNECQVCGAPAEEVHHIKHITPDNVNDVNITMNPDNLVSLCKACHFEKHRGEHGKGREQEEAYPYQFDSNGYIIPKENCMAVVLSMKFLINARYILVM